MSLTRMFCPSLCLGFLLAAGVSAAPSQPNILVVLVDDMGFSDLGCYGGEIETPHMDALASRGLRFSQFYNAGRCCPTRAALLTGLYPHQAGIGGMVSASGRGAYLGRLNDRNVTLAEALRAAGYMTAMSGKWHVGNARQYWPDRRGFDRFYGTPEGGGHHYRMLPRRTLVSDGQAIDVPEGWYSTTVFTDHGVRYIDEAKAAAKPLFLYVAYTAPHWPLQAPDETIAKSLRGQWSRKIGHVIDFMPTFLEIAGADYPKQRGDIKTIPLEGRSLLPALQGSEIARSSGLFFEHLGNAAIRLGQWKLVRARGQPWSLYDMGSDRTELYDRSHDQPTIAVDLKAKWNAWAERVGVEPR